MNSYYILSVTFWVLQHFIISIMARADLTFYSVRMVASVAER
jgi:type IV secretory pathway TrbD component